MNKNQFISELKIKLKHLPEHELDDALSYYEEYFKDGHIDDDIDVELELGSPTKLASQILSDYAVKDFSIKDKSINFSFSSIWFIILAILASPIALPLGFAMIVVIISLVFAMASIIIAFGSASVAIILSGIAMLSTSFSTITSSLSTFILYIGLGLALCGLGLLALIGVFTFGSFLLRLIIGFSSKSINKFNKRIHSNEV